MTVLKGRCSWFGGPNDTTGVTSSEDLAWWETWDQVVRDHAEELFLSVQPPGTTGLARRLNADAAYYIACRWDYSVTSKKDLVNLRVKVHAPRTGKTVEARPADWGPNEEETGRVADLSPALMSALGISTDDEVHVSWSEQQQEAAMYSSIVISSGHGKYVRGASGVLDEVDEARRVTDRLAEMLRERGVTVKTFHDDTSKDQNTNLNTIVNYHNKQTRDLDISVHFNAYEQTSKAMGVEVLYITQSALAGNMSAGIASCGFIDRGGKKRTDLFFLNNTNKPAVLIETCFVDSTADAELYNDEFEAVCSAIADELAAPVEEVIEEPPPDRPPRPAWPPVHPSPAVPRIDMTVSGDVFITINGVPVSP